MTQIITAVCENGILRPLEAVQLTEGAILKLQILTEETVTALPEARQAKQERQGLQDLIDSGLVTPPSPCEHKTPLSQSARRELADRLGQRPGKPLSEIIIEDRGPL